ncbi:MAG: C1 family peptidase [Steroidobacteraceae bacterium]
MPETLIDNAPQLAAFAQTLKALGYRSAEQAAGAAASAPADLARYLGIDVPALQAAFPPLRRAAGAAPKRRFSLGVQLNRIPRSRKALMLAPGAAVALPASVNLIAEMRPVRDQGQRGTCVAHASCAVAEHYWRGQGNATLDLSRQFLYSDCKQHDGDPTGEGTWVGVAMPCLVSDGCCDEAAWPYVMTPVPGNEGQGPPPPQAVAQAGQYKVPSFKQIAPTSIPDIKSALAGDRCVAFSIPVFNSWYLNDEVTRTGEIINPIPGEADVGGHAMCFVGYEDLPGDSGQGGGRFYVRNSWDAQWGTQSVLGTPGYGTIPYSYISGYCTEAYAIP